MSGLLSNVANFISGLAKDAEAVVALRNKPEELAAKLGLSKTATAALTDVDRFFQTEKPILQAPGQPIKAVKVLSAQTIKPGRAQSPSPGGGLVQAIPIQATNVEAARGAAPLTVLQQLAQRAPLTASADTGSLLPGPNTGTFTASGSGSGSLSGVAPSPGHPAPAPGPGPAIPPAPQVGPAPSLPPFVPSPPIPAPRPPAPPVPAPRPPFGPIGPAAPIPATPMSPPSPPPREPQIPMAAWADPRSAGCAGSCEAAVVAINALVSATAQASLTAIAAIASQRARRDGP